ncbi:hypothetical protein [Flagellimonas sp.]|uniref:hypothetical protein n=1 Tax=Flagellimonas sp. TaxID=2058762 RepID=UPI003BA8E583
MDRIKRSSRKKYADQDYLVLLNTVTKDIIKDIFISHHLDLDNKHRQELSKWFYLKEPVVSFRFRHYPEEKRLKQLFKKYLKRDFISYHTPFETFKSLFEARPLVNKIDWVDQKSSLYYFIKLLRKHNVIANTKNKHWMVASEFFLLKGELLIPKDFLNQKETQDQKKRQQLENFVKALAQLDS